MEKTVGRIIDERVAYSGVERGGWGVEGINEKIER